MEKIPEWWSNWYWTFIPNILKWKDGYNQRTLTDTLKEISAIIKAVGTFTPSGKPVLFIDEVDSLKYIKDEEIYQIFFNWLVSISKD